MYTDEASLRAKTWVMPCFWRAIQSELSPPVTRKKWLVPSALSSSAIASAAVVIAGLLARPRSDATDVRTAPRGSVPSGDGSRRWWHYQDIVSLSGTIGGTWFVR